MTDNNRCRMCLNTMVRDSEGNFVCLVKECCGSPTPAPRKEGLKIMIEGLDGDRLLYLGGKEICPVPSWAEADVRRILGSLNKALAPLLARAEIYEKALRKIAKPALGGKQQQQWAQEALAAWDSIKKEESK